MFIREDRKSVISTRNFAFKFGNPKAARFRQNLSYNFNLLSMIRNRGSFHLLKLAVGRDKSVNFEYVYYGRPEVSHFSKKVLFLKQQNNRNVRRCKHGRKQTLDRDKSLTFPYVY